MTQPTEKTQAHKYTHMHKGKDITEGIKICELCGSVFLSFDVSSLKCASWNLVLRASGRVVVGVSVVLVICGRLSQGTADRTPHITDNTCREAVHMQPRTLIPKWSLRWPFWLKVWGFFLP